VGKKTKVKQNIFHSPQSLKKWSLSLSDACGSIIVQKPHNAPLIDKLVEQFVDDYNINVEQAQNGN
tara:strand:- start:21880 stop:22077 length:198 start_codon:yes stop_codon:yes gene_type:complete